MINVYNYNQQCLFIRLLTHENNIIHDANQDMIVSYDKLCFEMQRKLHLHISTTIDTMIQRRIADVHTDMEETTSSPQVSLFRKEYNREMNNPSHCHSMAFYTQPNNQSWFPITFLLTYRYSISNEMSFDVTNDTSWRE